MPDFDKRFVAQLSCDLSVSKDFTVLGRLLNGAPSSSGASTLLTDILDRTQAVASLCDQVYDLSQSNLQDLQNVLDLRHLSYNAKVNVEFVLSQTQLLEPLFVHVLPKKPRLSEEWI